MNDELLFSEKQKFTQWWLWLVLIGLDMLFISEIIRYFQGELQAGNNPFSNLSVFTSLVIMLLVTLIFLCFKLDTQITRKGIQVRFFPFHFQYRFFTWEDISGAYVRKYNPLLEYGGWGLRGVGKNRAFNVSGNKGLQLEFSDGRKLLIGTRKQDELTAALKKLIKYSA